MSRLRVVRAAAVAAFLAVAAAVAWVAASSLRVPGERVFSGTIEATVAYLAFQIGGRVERVPVEEGALVEAGALLAVLDGREVAAQRDQAEADLRRAEEQRRQLELLLEVNRRVLPAEVERAAAALRALSAQAAEAESGLRAQEVERARLAAEAARAVLENARRDFERLEALFRRGVVAAQAHDAARTAFETALHEHGRAVEAYRLAREGFRAEEIETARARLAEGRAALALAESNLGRLAALEQEVRAAEAQGEAARAALRLAEVRFGHRLLHAPFAGTVLQRSLEPGEVVAPGREVFALADLSRVELRLFIDVAAIGAIRPGQEVAVTIDTFPGKIYPGRVAYISPRAEFTPKIIQTPQERVKLVHLVKVVVENPDHELKPGMPADGRFR
ncbi:MAG: HlyD family efflux transporter periplasmic adaptor subunit [Desulfobacterales bacterium]